MKENYTEIIVVLDRSGSMQSIAKDMSGGYNSFIEEQKKDKVGEKRISLYQFDDKYEAVYSGCLVESVPPLNLVPRGYTALLDAIGKAITDTGLRFRAMKEEDRPSKVLMMIITDGGENASKEFGHTVINKMITEQREKYSWEFIFLGANQDSITVARDLGINTTNTYNFAASSKSVDSLWLNTSRGVTAYASAQCSTADNILNMDTNTLVEDENKTKSLTSKITVTK